MSRDKTINHIRGVKMLRIGSKILTRLFESMIRRCQKVAAAVDKKKRSLEDFDNSTYKNSLQKYRNTWIIKYFHRNSALLLSV